MINVNEYVLGGTTRNQDRSVKSNQTKNKSIPSVVKNHESMNSKRQQTGLSIIKGNTNNNLQKNFDSNFISSNKFSSKIQIKEEKKVKDPFSEMPSSKYTKIKSSDPFKLGKKHKSNFGYVYSAGGIPCRIEHGSSKLKLKWDVDLSKLDYDPILVICFEGLVETEHPYNFAAKQCIREMLSFEGAKDKLIPILSKIINPLRLALTSSNYETFAESLEILEIVSNLSKDNLDQYLHFFLQQINKKSFDIKLKEKVHNVLRTLESNGGELALKEIKKKIPTYMSIIKN